MRPRALGRALLVTVTVVVAGAWGAGGATGSRTVSGVPADTLLDVRRGERLVVTNVAGSLSVEAWEEDRLELRTPERGGDLVVRREGTTLLVTGRNGPRGGRARSEARLRIPSWMELVVEGIRVDVEVRGLAGRVSVRTVSGDVRLAGTSGQVEARSVDGLVLAEGVSGRHVLTSQSDDVRVTGATGALEVRSGSGDLLLEGVRAERLRAETQDGDLTFSGPLVPGGTYAFFVHHGDVALRLPDDAGGRVRVSTFAGEFRSDFPVVLPSFRSGRAFEFELGGGGAAVTVEVFDGEIRLVRQGDAP